MANILKNIKRTSTIKARTYTRKHENGNALWFILIGVVLVGILTMVLSRGASNTDQSGDVEQRRIQASQLLRYGKSVQTAIEQMKLRGVSENDISFEHGAGFSANPNCAIDDCKVFSAGGGGLSYQDFPSLNDASPWIFTAANNVGTAAGPAGSTAAGSGNDIVMLLSGANAALCAQINRDLGVGTAGTIPGDTSGITTSDFNGTFPTTGPVVIDGDPAPFELDGHEAGCFTDTGPETTYFYYVVLAR